MDAVKCLCAILFTIHGVLSALYPFSDIKCKLEDEKCMTESVQKVVPSFMSGVPELGIEVLDVMELDIIHLDLSGLKYTLSEGRLKGLKNLLVKSVKWDTDKKTIDVTYHVNSTLTGNYKATGQVLILPITGDGQARLKLRNMMVKFTLNYDLKKKDDKEYIHLTKFSFLFDVIDNANFHLTNLFNGNKELSNAMHTFLNDNWKTISVEFGTPIIQAVAEKIYKNCIIFFNKYPIHEISLT